MRNSYPYLEFMRIARECRNILIADTLHTNSPDLYDALYSDCRSQIFQIKIELYEIKWLELQDRHLWNCGVGAQTAREPGAALQRAASAPWECGLPPHVRCATASWSLSTSE